MPFINLGIGIPKKKKLRIHRKRVDRLTLDGAETEITFMTGPKKGQKEGSSKDKKQE